ncbi:alpha/beta hydrolase [Kordiimonas sediminis]|uniref:Alpha/beta hydrolase n=1 Tax=Kordiimonas sediminis TaxID=1735581 RepID=A0A919AJ18_9PROT|nr:alpha/beta fold hydrolase [Kordiimonas sediminis]GHF11792.1 alpha/beta hydrolase [Kordiimonas sediminis]
MAESKAPRPLPLHLANAASLWGSASSAARLFAQDSLIIHDSLQDDFAALKQLVGDGDAGWHAFQTDVSAKAQQYAADFLHGMRSYMEHPYKRPATQAQAVRQVGAAELLDYGGIGQPVFLIPSLINPYYILDLKPGRSLAAYLKNAGFRVFLVNWNEPEEERGFGLSDYILKCLAPMLEYIQAVVGVERVATVGYCMGGTLAAGLAAVRPKQIGRLGLLASPWDFNTAEPMAGRAFLPLMARLLDILPDSMPVPIDLLQVFFTSLDPTLTDRKFRRFSAMDTESPAAEFFVALEHWANSGAPLSQMAARDCLQKWYQDNQPVKGQWAIRDQSVRPQDFDFPTLVAAPTGDRLVPASSALAFSQGMQDCTVLEPNAGHVGMVVGSKAEAGLWQPLADWLQA